MRKPISRESFPPPRNGRRIPSIASTKADAGEDRPNARDLLATVNSASEGATATWLAFLGTMAYLAVTLGGVTHVDLLLNNDTTLPFVNVKVPLVTFFVMAPLAFVLVHFSLLLQHVVLSRKLAAFEMRLAKEEPSRDRSTQNIRDELHSYTFTQVASGKPKSAVVDTAQRLVVSLTLVVFPLLLLTFFQIGFLAYQSEPITWWHRGMLALDVGVVWALARHLVRIDPASKVRLTDWWHATSRTKWRLIIGWRRLLDGAQSAVASRPSPGASLVRPLLSGARRGGASAIRSVAPTRAIIIGLLFFSICVATLPDSALDEATASIALVSKQLPYRPRQTTDVCPIRVREARCAFWPTAYLFEREVNYTTGKSDSALGWSRNLIVTDKLLVDHKRESPPSLRGRDLRYATLDRSDLKRVDFFDAQLQGARLNAAELNGAKFAKARLHDVDLREVNLKGVELAGAELHRVRFRSANLQGMNFSHFDLKGADFTRANLQGADFSSAELQGATFFVAQLQGANLSRARLQGAKLEGANLQGADLAGAQLQGVDLGTAMLQGADLSYADLQGANLFRANLQGADLIGANSQGADFSETQVWSTSTPRDEDGDALNLASFRGLRIGALDSEQRLALQAAASSLKAVLAAIPKEDSPRRERVGAAAKKIAARVGPLFER